MPTRLFERIRHARKAANKTQIEVAKKLGISREAVSLWEAPPEKKGTAPSRENLIAFVSVTGCPFGWLVDDNSELDWEPSQTAGRQRKTIEAVEAIVDHMVDRSPVDLPQAVLNRAAELAVPIVERFTAEAILGNLSTLDAASADLSKAMRQARG